MARRKEGSETWHRLRDWNKGQAPSERLAVLLLRVENYRSVDPSHPLGGPDGLKDVVCVREGKKWVVGVYFPRGQKQFNKTKVKFENDLNGVETNDADGFIFITNQELRMSEREELKDCACDTPVDLFHLERLASILNSPACYGIRLDFLDIEMTKEEQLSFVAYRDAALLRIEKTQSELVSRFDSIQSGNFEQPIAEPHAPYYVNPTVSNSVVSASLFGEIVHRCTNCGFGYFITSLYSGGVPIAMGAAGGQTITCPNCGNVETY